MQINEAGLTLIKDFEGVRLIAYKDLVGIWTIGFGSTRDVHPGMVITQEEADQRLREDLSHFEYGVEKLLTCKVNENQFSALVSFAYNLGLGNFKASLLLRCINKGNFADAAMQFSRWVKAGGNIIPGLVRRRSAERELFLS